MAILKFHKGNFRVKGKTVGLPLKQIWANSPLSLSYGRPKTKSKTYLFVFGQICTGGVERI